MNYQIGTTVFKDWKITRELGEGAYGKVFEIQKNNFGITAISALKVLQVPRSQSDVQAAYSEGMDEQSITSYFQECVERLVKEIAILSELKGHSNIMGLEDYDVIQRTDVFGWDILIRMELLTSLQDHQRNHPFSEQDVIQLGCDLCNALSFCHKRNLIHRDIKPANIFVGTMGQYKLGDFGVSRNMEATVSNMSKAGTESYMAPEVYLGHPYSPNVDLYSLGLVLFQLSNGGRLPFLPPAPQPLRFTDRENALRRRMNGEPLPTPNGASMALADVIRKACAFDPKDRYQTADEMLAALNALGQPSAPPRQDTPRTVFTPPYKVDNPKEVGGGLDSLEELGGGFDESTDEFDEKTEATVSAFDRKPSEKQPSSSTQTPPTTNGPAGPVYARKTLFGTIYTTPDANPLNDMFGEFFGGSKKQTATKSTQAQPASTPAKPQTSTPTKPQTSTARPGNQTPTVYFDRQPAGINKEIARKNVTPGQAEIWVTPTLMNGIAAGAFPNLALSVFYDNGIVWAYSGNTLKAYMTELKSAVDKGYHTITIVNRFPELPGLQERIYVHLHEVKANDVFVAMYDGVSSMVTLLSASGKWVSKQNTKPTFVSDVAPGANSNPFYGITSFLYQPPKRVRITSALANLGTRLQISGYGEPKKIMEIPPMASNLPSYLGYMSEELLPGQMVNIAEFFRVEAIVPSNKLALWLPDDGKVYTAMMKSSAKEGKFTMVEYHQSKYVSLCKIFE